MSFSFYVRVFLCSHYRLTRYHIFQFEKHVCEMLSRPFHSSSFFSELFPPITEKYFQINLSCVVEDDEKLTHTIKAEQFSFKSHASFCRSTATIIKLILRGLLSLTSRRKLTSMNYRKCCFVRKMMPYNKLLTNFTCSGPYWGISALGRFCTDLAALGPYCHDLGPIFPSTALAFS